MLCSSAQILLCDRRSTRDDIFKQVAAAAPGAHQTNTTARIWLLDDALYLYIHNLFWICKNITNVVPFLHIPSQLHAVFYKEFGKNIFWELEEQQSENWVCGCGCGCGCGCVPIQRNRNVDLIVYWAINTISGNFSSFPRTGSFGSAH